MRPRAKAKPQLLEETTEGNAPLRPSYCQQSCHLLLQFWQMVDDHAPENIRRQAVITMYDVISCIHNLPRIGNGNIFFSLQNSVHRLADNLYVPLNGTSKAKVTAKILKPFFPFRAKETFYLLNGRQYVLQVFLCQIIHKSMF